MNPDNSVGDGSEAAAEMIRHKLDALYAAEPEVSAEKAALATLPASPSKHQQFLKDLISSGAKPEDVEKSWHTYYQQLPDEEKHQVWREFYSSQKQQRVIISPSVKARRKKIIHPHRPMPHAPENPSPLSQKLSESLEQSKNEQFSQGPQAVIAHFETDASEPITIRKLGVPKAKISSDIAKASVAEVKQKIVSRVKSRQKLQAKHHAQSLLFGLGVGSLVLLVFMFGFFNERFIAPFITPSRNVSATPIIINASDTTVNDPIPKVIIPKINVEIPVVYDEPSVEEKAVQAALERGVVHYATTPAPGQDGNVVIFGHSSNNIFNKGDYKFAFVLLNRLEVDDTFYLTKDGVRYTYQIFEKKVVEPTAVEVLNPTTNGDTATLITCDPPGTTINRLVVIGKQISPDPSANTASTAIAPDAAVTVVPSNAPSLWERIKNWF